MATLKELENALVAADAAGNAKDAKAFADEIQRRRNRGATPATSAFYQSLLPAIQGPTLGWGEELGGLGAVVGARLAGKPWSEAILAWPREVARQREALAEAREENPYLAYGTEIGTSLIGGVPLAGRLMNLGLRAGFRPTTSMIGAGTVEGAIGGAGAAGGTEIEGAAGELQDKGLGAAIGAGVGGTLSGVLPGLGYGLRQGWEALRPLGQRLGEGPTTTASRLMGERLRAEGITGEDLIARQAVAGPEATMADIGGEGLFGLTQGVLQRDPAALARGRQLFRERAEGSTERIRRGMEKAFGLRERMQPSLDALRARQRELSGDAYATAYEREIPLTPTLESLLGRRRMQQAFERAKLAADTRGEQLPPFFQINELGEREAVGVMPDMRAWDHMKRGIDRLIDAETDPVTGRISSDGRDLVLMKRELMEELDEINPDYKKARAIFAGDEALQNATRQGEKMLTMKTREVSAVTKDMTESEREAFLTGAVEAMREKMGRARAGEIGEFKFMELPNFREKLESMLPSGAEGKRRLNDLMQVLRTERQFAERTSDLVRGSQTALRMAGGGAVESGVAMPTTTEAITHPMVGLAQGAYQAVRRQLSKISDQSIEELAQMLLTPGNAPQVVAELQRRGVPDEVVVNFVNTYSKGLTGLTGTAGALSGGLINE